MAEYDSKVHLDRLHRSVLSPVRIEVREAEVEPESPPFNYRSYLLGFLIGCGLVIWAIN